MNRIYNFVKNFLNHPNRYRYLLSRLLLKSRLGNYIKIKRNGYTIRLSENNIASEMFIQGNHFYRNEENFIISLLKDDSTFVDIGANIGNLSLAASNIITNGKIFAIEAQSNTYKSLLQNINDNSKNIDTFNLAVSDEKGLVFMTDLDADDCNFISSDNHKNEISVQADTIDNILNHHDKCIDLLKIDVEGFELMVLKGADKTLTRTKFIYFELWDELTSRFEYVGSEIIDLLYSKGFKVYHINNFELGEEVTERAFPNISEYIAVSSKNI